MNHRFTGLLLGSLFATALSAQEIAPSPCGANDLHKLERFHHNDPVELAKIQAADEALETFTREFEGLPKGGNAYIVPVVFHIIHNNGVENISDEQIYDAMRVLNEDYSRMNSDWQNVKADFLPLVADVGIEFRLARKDPQGNCTKGITRTVSPLTTDGTQTMKSLIQWPRNKYLNVWVAASADGAAGYTYRPGAVANWPEADGIVLLHNYTGSIGTSSVNRSRTLTHEVGHWINLSHTWGSTNEPALAANCSDDDNVSDTPNTIGWTSCNVNGVSCGSLDNVENYMEYSYCSKMFTEGQKTRMLAALNSGTSQRNQLWSTANLNATGLTSAPVLCAAEFTGTNGLICSGNSVTFTDVSFHGVTSRTWSFPGGTPASSSDASTTVNYTEPGVYPVTLTVSDGTSTLSTTTNAYVTVLADPGQSVPVVEGFESISGLPSNEWFVNNPDNDNTFNTTTTAAYTGSSSVRLLNQSSMSGRTDELLTSTYDMSEAVDVNISFRYAFAQRNSSNADVLRVYVSNNCGATWSLRKIMYANTSLTTAGVVTSSFVPNGPDQWGYTVVDNVSASYHTSRFRIKFEFVSGGGNNLYLDDININGMPVGLEESIAARGGSLLVVPNPVQDMAQAIFLTKGSERVRMEVIDVTGRTVRQLFEGALAPGQQRLDVPVSGLQSGAYFLRMQQGDRQEVSRFVVD
jgi:PKD repeat protein